MSNEFQSVVPAPTNELAAPEAAVAPVAPIVEEVVPEVPAEPQIAPQAPEPVIEGDSAFEAPETNSDTPPPLTAEEIQAAANKAAIDASAAHHLNHIFRTEVAESHGKIAQIVAKIAAAAERTGNWTYEEVKAVWETVKSEL